MTASMQLRTVTKGRLIVLDENSVFPFAPLRLCVFALNSHCIETAKTGRPCADARLLVPVRKGKSGL